MALSPSDIAAIRTAEQALAEAFEAADPTAWVDYYTEDAIFAAPAVPTIQGRAALLEAAGNVAISSMLITAESTLGDAELASTFGGATWVGGPKGSDAPLIRRRFLMVWRKDDGRWRIARELLTDDLQRFVRVRREHGQGTLSEAIFAAGLDEVVAGSAPAVYGDPETFFAGTHPSAGLKSLLDEALGRIGGGKPDAPSVIRLETNLGGGKTHNLIALYHAARGDLPFDQVKEFMTMNLCPLARRARPMSRPKTRKRAIAVWTMTIARGMAAQLELLLVRRATTKRPQWPVVFRDTNFLPNFLPNQADSA